MNASNAKDFVLEGSDEVFPYEGVYFGEYETIIGNKAPALLPIDQTNGVCFLSTPDNVKTVKQTLQMIALRLALSLPPRLCKFTLYDASDSGLGLICLGNLDPFIIGERIITEKKELLETLRQAKTAITDTIQKTLGYKYADKTLVEYNEVAGDMAKPYHFIVLTDVPNSLDKETGELLTQIVKTGRKAGYYVLMNLDTGFEKKDSFSFDPVPLLDMMTTVYEKGDRWYVHNVPNEGLLHRLALHLDSEMPDPDVIESVQFAINDNLKKSQSVAVSLADRLTEKVFWTKDSSNGVETPIGKVNSFEVQYMKLGVEDGISNSYHHCLVGGATGSGKTVLLHNIICNTAWLYSPDEVQFLLLDYKEGTEFNIYKNLPHVKVLSIKSELEFAMNMFEFIDCEITRRGELFTKLGVSNLRKYNEKSEEKLPRYIIIIDEFQKLFDSGISLAEKFSARITDISKRGRSFGINMILSTQGLGGLNMGSALSEIGLRIAMRLDSETECNRILSSGNTAPLMFSKKGESVYCPGGQSKNNSIFQVAFLKDSKISSMISYMKEEYEKRASRNTFTRYIFDGDSPADINENTVLKEKPIPENGPIKVYVGTPFALVDGHVYFTLKRENGYNVLMVGQDTEAAMSVMYHSLEQIIALSPKESKFVICDKTNSDNPLAKKLSELGEEYVNAKTVTDDADIVKYVEIMYNELERRKTEKGNDPRMVLAIFNVYNFRKARVQSEMMSPIANKLVKLLQDGPDFGIHLMVYADTFKHYQDVFGLRALQEWRIKIELKGGDGQRIFGSDLFDKTTVYKNYTANMATAEQEEKTEKIRLYKL